jgi:D-glycero-D-manno-heptose 1,7-bisphosphate phosphatase
VDEINEHVRGRLGINHVRTCDHDDADRCHCRKPLPGMLLDAARAWGIDLASSVMVGDRAKDILAGRAAGCATVLVDGGHGEGAGSAHPDAKFGRLEEAVEWVVAYADRARKNDSSSRSPSTEPTS